MRGFRQLKGLSVLFLSLLLITFAYGLVNTNLIGLIAPANQTFTSGTNDTILFQFNQTLNTSVSPGVNCTLVIGNASGIEADYGTNHTTQPNSTLTLYANNTLNEGVYLWGIRCMNDTATESHFSDNRTLTIDRTPPNATLYLPAANANVSTRNLNFTWFVHDMYSTIMSCNLTIDSGINTTTPLVEVNASGFANLTVNFSNDRAHTWNVSCYDNATNRNVSLSRIVTIDATKPNVSSVLPTFINEVADKNFNWTVKDAPAGVQNCTLLLDGVFNSSTYYNLTNGLGNVSMNFTVPGTYNLTANCSDTAGNYNESMTTTITINDTTKPNFTELPLNITRELGSILYDINGSDNKAVANYSINDTINFRINSTGLLENATNLHFGNYSLTIIVNDTNNNKFNITIIINVSDSTRPAWNSTSNITVEYGNPVYHDLNATDLSPLDKFFIGDQINLTINSATGVITNRSGILNIGSYVFNISINDTAGNTAWAELNITINDSTNPTWDQTAPNQTIEWRDPFYLDINASDLNQTRFWIRDATNFSVNVTTGVIINNTELKNLTYWLNITVNDSAGNGRTVMINVTVLNSTPYATSRLSSAVTTTTTTIDVIASEYVNATIDYGINYTLASRISNSSYLVTHGALAITGLTAGTTYFYNLTLYDRAGNRNLSGPWSFTTASNPTPSSGGGGGGGGGVMSETTSIPYKTVDSTVVEASLTKVWASLAPSESGTFNIGAAGIPVTAVTVSVATTVASPTLRVGTLAGKPSTITEAAPKVYKYLEFTKTILTNNDITSASIAFKVPKSWLSANGLAANKMALYRYADNKWAKLSTSVSKEDSENVYYSATTPGFSYFAIASEAPGAAPAAAEETTEPAPAPAKTTVSTAPAKKALQGTTLLWILAVVVIAVIIYIILGGRKKPRYLQ